MAKNASPKKDSAPSISFGLPKGFPQKAPEAEKKAAAPEPAQISPKEAASRIRGYGKGWDEELEALFAFPEKLYLLEGDGWAAFSKEKDFGVSKVAGEIGRRGAFSKPETEYGISLSETTSTLYLVLVDMARRVVIRFAVQRLQDSPPEKDWGEFKSALKSCIDVAKGDKNIIAYHDGMLRQVRLD